MNSIEESSAITKAQIDLMSKIALLDLEYSDLLESDWFGYDRSCAIRNAFYNLFKKTQNLHALNILLKIMRPYLSERDLGDAKFAIAHQTSEQQARNIKADEKRRSYQLKSVAFDECIQVISRYRIVLEAANTWDDLLLIDQECIGALIEIFAESGDEPEYIDGFTSGHHLDRFDILNNLYLGKTFEKSARCTLYEFRSESEFIEDIRKRLPGNADLH